MRGLSAASPLGNGRGVLGELEVSETSQHVVCPHPPLGLEKAPWGPSGVLRQESHSFDLPHTCSWTEPKDNKDLRYEDFFLLR